MPTRENELESHQTLNLTAKKYHFSAINRLPGPCFRRIASHTAIMRTCISLMVLAFSGFAQSAAFQGGHDALIELAQDWVAAETNTIITRIEIKPPDLRVPIKPCQSEPGIRFPFSGNKRTIEVLCKEPSWKRYLRVNINDSIKRWAFSSDLPAGIKLQESHLTLMDFPSDNSSKIYELSSILERILKNDVQQGDIVSEKLMADIVTVYITKDQYEPGQQIYLKDLSVVSDIGKNTNKLLDNWPTGPVTAAIPLEAGRRLSGDDIKASNYVVVAKKTVINGQIITPDLIETRLQPIKAFGAKPIKDIAAVLGLAASRTLRKGDIITFSDLVVADLIKKNERVRLKIHRGLVQITLEAIALENAKMGEHVNLINPESGRQVQGIVTGRNEAKGL